MSASTALRSRRRRQLMCHAVAANNLQCSEADDPDIEAERLAPEIFDLKPDLFGNRKLIPTIHLRPSRQTGYEVVDTVLGSQFRQIMLIEQCGTGPNKAHIASQNAPELGQLIKAGCAQERADRSLMTFGVRQQMGCNCRSPDTHRPEFRHLEDSVLPPDPIRPI